MLLLDFIRARAAEFEVARGHDTVDGPLAEFVGQVEDARGDLAQAAVLLFQTVQFQRLLSGRPSVRQRWICSA